MPTGRVRNVIEERSFGFIKLSPTDTQTYQIDEVAFNFKDLVSHEGINRNDTVAFELRQARSGKYVAQQVQIIERAPPAQHRPSEETSGRRTFTNTSRVRNSAPSRVEPVVVENGGNVVGDTENNDELSIGDDNLDQLQSASLGASGASGRSSTGRLLKPINKSQSKQSKGDSRRLPKQVITGKILHIKSNYGLIEPSDDLPEGYPENSNVSFDPNYSNSGQLQLLIGDEVRFTLGTQDKDRPRAFDVHLNKGKPRLDDVIKEHLNRIINILSGHSQSFLSQDTQNGTEELTGANLETNSKKCLFSILNCNAMWETIGNSHSISNETILLLVDTILEVNKKSQSMGRCFVSLLEDLADTKLFNINTGSFCQYVKHITVAASQEERHKIHKFLLLVLQNVPSKTHTVLSMIKLMIPPEPGSLEHFLFQAMKEIAKQNCIDSDDREWNDMTLVPTSLELTGQHEEYFSNLRSVRKEGSYESAHEYLDVYFRLLRADCFGSICKHVQELCKGKLDYRDMNVYHPVQLHGLSVTTTESSLTVMLKIKSCVPVNNWATTTKLMYGNLLCISPSGTFKDVIWATVAQRDVDMLKQNLISVELCTACNQYNDSEALIRMCAAGNKMVAVESPTYYNAFKPVLASLQSLNPEELPFQDELIFGRPSEHLPDYIRKYMNQKGVHLEEENEASFSTLEKNWPGQLDIYQRRALKYIFTHRIACVQGPPGTGKSFIGSIAVGTILEMETKPPGPILILTYKNHALDEFLKDMIQKYPSGIIRIGGRSKEEILSKCNLNEIKSQVNRDELLRKSIAEKRNEIDRTVPALTKSIEYLQSCLQFTEKTFINFLTRDQLLSFLGEYRLSGTSQFLEEPLNQLFADFEQHGGTNLDFFDSDRMTIFLSAFKMWKPKETDRKTGIPKCVSEFLVNVNERFKKSSTNAVNTIEEETEDEEYVEDLEKERFCAVSSNKTKTNRNSLIELHNKVDQSYLIKCIDSPEELEDDNLLSTPNPWSLSEYQRKRLIQLLLLKQLAQPIEDVQAEIQYYEQLCAERNELDDQHKIYVLQSAKIIGMTMTGASLNSHLLKAVKPAIVLIEEAAEVLEPQIISVLGSWVQHLIMIGDHKQLRPQVENFELTTQFHLDLSMMERLINNNIPFRSLAIQNRMRPEFSALLKDIYNDLQDGLKVHLNEPVKCIDKSMFFWNHQDQEEHSRSFTNSGEAKRVVQLALFLVQQGYDPSKITVLAAYQGQVRLLKQKLTDAARKWKNIFEDYLKQVDESGGPVDPRRLFKVSTVDMYQGDENDIVIISMVRSNNIKKIGFWKEFNRRCVAQSRARCGMYFCGNANTFATAAKGTARANWPWFLSKMREADCLGPTITLQCPKHHESKINAETAEDITMQTFCKIPCHTNMSCRLHICIKPCQPPHSHVQCKEIVEFTFIRCGHMDKRQCYQKEEEILCKKPCQQTMDCRIHPCHKRCFPDHPHHFCAEKVKYTCSACGNENDKFCSESESSVRCEHDVEFTHPTCGHTNTKRCYESVGKCRKACEKLLPVCRHICSLKCGDECNPDACKTCKILKKNKEEVERKAQKQKRLTDIRRELEEIMANDTGAEVVEFIHLYENNDEQVREYLMVKDLAEKFVQPGHGIRINVISVEKVVNLRLRAAFLRCQQGLNDPTVSDLKFHGTEEDNIPLICSNGFRLPSKPGMFGAGIYFATDSSKSEIYTKGSNALLLCEVALGKVLVTETAMNDMNLEKLKEQNKDSLFAKRGTRSTRGVLYDEFVIFRPEQAIPKYIIRYESSRTNAGRAAAANAESSDEAG